MNIPFPLYCEHAIDGFLTEPLNVISNVSFIFSAIFIVSLLKKYYIKDKLLWVLPIIVGSIGIGSATWHTFRLPFTLLMDAVPIYIFILIVLYYLLSWLVNSKGKALLIVVSFVFFQVSLWLLLPSSVTNSSIRHGINLIAFSLVLFFINKKNGSIPKDNWYAFSFYFLAIIFKSIDLSMCSYFSHGTHMLWHILNAVAVYFAVKMLLGLSKLKFEDIVTS